MVGLTVTVPCASVASEAARSIVWKPPLHIAAHRELVTAVVLHASTAR